MVSTQPCPGLSPLSQVPLPALPSRCLAVPISTSRCHPPVPYWDCNTEGALLSKQIHTEPEWASTAVPHSLRLGWAETPGRKLRFGELGANSSSSDRGGWGHGS